MTDMSLVDALLSRRSRRFGFGMELPAGPLTFRSAERPAPLTLEQEAILAFAAVGITGTALAEMEFTSGTPLGGAGNIIAGFIGRTAASAEAIQSIGLAVINDEGAWYVRRPQDLPADEVAVLVELGRRREFVEWYQRIRIPIAAPGRIAIPPTPPFTPPFNRWDTNRPGTTCFLPIIEATAIFLNCLLTAMSEEFGVFILDDGVDEQGGGGPFKPAGLEDFAKEAGGHLRSDGRDIGFVITITFLEMTMLQFLSAELGAILQNVSLMAQALGLGGFMHAAQHPIWLKQLGFLDRPVSFERIMGVGQASPDLLEKMGYAEGVPTFTAQRGGDATRADSLPRSFCPPDFPSMSAAVQAFVDRKYAQGAGLFRGGAATPWRADAGVEAGIQEYSPKAIAAVTAYCGYVFNRYRRFPTLTGPISTLLGYQAHRVDTGFYDQFYKPEAVR